MSHPAVGQPAPPIEVGEWVSGRPEAEDVFAGRNVILEFWGTHCGPCISAIPHLNELASTYGGAETLFVSLSPEDARTIERFLEKRPIKGSVAIDSERATFDAYGIRSIPHTFLIDAKGLLRWHGHPNHFTAELLETFLREDRVPEVAEPAASPETAPVETPDAPFFLRIDRNASDRREYGSRNGDGRFEAEFHGCRALVVIRDLLDHPRSRLRIEGNQLVHHLERSTDGSFFNETELQGKYDFSLPLEPLDETRRVLKEEYGLQVEAQVREVEIVTLSIAGDAID